MKSIFVTVSIIANAIVWMAIVCAAFTEQNAPPEAILTSVCMFSMSCLACAFRLSEGGGE